MALASGYQLNLLCKPDSPSRLSIATLDPAFMVLFCGEPAAPWPRTASNHGAVSPCRHRDSYRPHSTPWKGTRSLAHSIMALSRLRPLVGGCLAEVCGPARALSCSPCCCYCCYCCYYRPVTKLTGAPAASRASGPLIRHPSAWDFGVTGPGGLSRGQRPGRRHRDPSRPRSARLLPVLPGRAAPPSSITNSQATTWDLQAQVPCARDFWSLTSRSSAPSLATHGRWPRTTVT